MDEFKGRTTLKTVSEIKDLGNKIILMQFDPKWDTPRKLMTFNDVKTFVKGGAILNIQIGYKYFELLKSSFWQTTVVSRKIPRSYKHM